MFSKLYQGSSTINRKQRILGPAENALIKTSLQQQGYMKIGDVLHLQGPYISLEMLTMAVNYLQCRHPFLRSRLQINPAKEDSYQMIEDETLRLQIREISRNRADHLNYWRQEWQEREKQPVIIGEGLAEFWLLQDANDNDNKNGRREIVFVCEHSISDLLSVSTVAHELLMALGNDDKSMFANSLNWPISIETAIHASLSTWNKLIIFSKLVLAVAHRLTITNRTISRIPLASVDFSLNDMAKYCHTEAFYGSLNKEETQKLVEACRQKGVTVTATVSSAILCASATLINIATDRTAQLTLAMVADTRRRCIPPVPNHELSYQVSETIAFRMAQEDAPTTLKGMWQLAKTFGDYMKTTIDAGQTLALGMMMGRFYQRNLDPIDPAELPTCEISSLGRLPFHERYGKWELVAVAPITNVIRTAMPFILIQTVNGILTIGFLGAAPVISLSTLENLCTNTMHNLRQMVDMTEE